MPERSRTIVTGASRPFTTIIPLVCGECGGCGAGAERPHAVPSVTASRHANVRRTDSRSHYTETRMLMRDGLLAEFDHEIAATKRMFRSVPNHLLAWTPHERCRS